MSAIPKEHALRSEAYKAWVRDHDCVVCGAPAPSEPHHIKTGGMGRKCDDRWSIPTCRRCHDLLQERKREALRAFGWCPGDELEVVVRLICEWYDKEG